MSVREIGIEDEVLRGSSSEYDILYSTGTAEKGFPPVDTAEYSQSDIIFVRRNSGNLQRADSAFIGWNTAPDWTGSFFKATGMESAEYSGDSITFYPQFRAVADSTFLYDVYLDAPAGSIANTAAFMEYSRDDGRTWNQCDSDRTAAGIMPGELIWIREAANPANSLFLGQVRETEGPDLISGSNLKVRDINGNYRDPAGTLYTVPGAELELIYTGRNLGSDAGYHQGTRYDFYLSTDRIITTEDLLLLSRTDHDPITREHPFSLGPSREGYDHSGRFVFPDTASGEYFIGVIADAGMNVSESSEDNNRSHPGEVLKCVVLSNDSEIDGAFKIVNSWGRGGWENRPDGHYWMTYEAVKDKELMVGMYYNNFNDVYRPSVLAVFGISHPARSQCRITFTLGDPSGPVEEKEFVTSLSGNVSFPENLMALDISEFAYGLNEYDLFMNVEIDKGSTAAYLTSFSIELYDSERLLRSYESAGVPRKIDAGNSYSLSLATAGSLNPQQLAVIAPVSRSSLRRAAGLIIEPVPESELREDMDRYGVFTEGVNYNQLYDGRWGTGYAPMTAEEWGASYKLSGIEGVSVVSPPDTIDHSLTPYFPPIANQGRKGSCTAFSLGYYIQTYTEARERGWDLTGTVFSSYYLAPTTNRDKIFSPDFIYHQINHGVDRGSSPFDAVDVIVNIGGALWADLPYDVNQINSWGSEDVWRKAGAYRGRENSSESTYVYFTVRDNAGVEILKRLLREGYCVSTGIRTKDIYNNLDRNDVYRLENGPWTGPINHAQTIVGYKEGTAWDPQSPDL